MSAEKGLASIPFNARSTPVSVSELGMPGRVAALPPTVSAGRRAAAAPGVLLGAAVGLSLCTLCLLPAAACGRLAAGVPEGDVRGGRFAACACVLGALFLSLAACARSRWISGSTGGLSIIKASRLRTSCSGLSLPRRAASRTRGCSCSAGSPAMTWMWFTTAMRWAGFVTSIPLGLSPDAMAMASCRTCSLGRRVWVAVSPTAVSGRLEAFGRDPAALPICTLCLRPSSAAAPACGRCPVGMP